MTDSDQQAVLDWVEDAEQDLRDRGWKPFESEEDWSLDTKYLLDRLGFPSLPIRTQTDEWQRFKNVPEIMLLAAVLYPTSGHRPHVVKQRNSPS